MEEVKEKKKKNLALRIMFRIVISLLIVVCSIIIFFNATHSYYVVYGPSMTPTLNEGVLYPSESKDGVFVSKIKSYTRGDIVVAKRNDEETQKYVIKRIIAIGGDKIKIELIEGVNRVVLIKNGENESVVLDEEYIDNYEINKYLLDSFNSMIINCGYTLDENGYLLIEKDCVFYLGDNRINSKDSSSYGMVLKKDIVGKVDYIVYGNTNMYGQVIQQFFGW